MVPSLTSTVLPCHRRGGNIAGSNTDDRASCDDCDDSSLTTVGKTCESGGTGGSGGDAGVDGVDGCAGGDDDFGLDRCDGTCATVGVVPKFSEAPT